MSDRNEAEATVPVDSTRQKAKGKRQKAEGKRRKAEGKRQEAEGKRQEAEGRGQKVETPHTSLQTPHFLPIGKVVAAQGMKGEVRVYPESDFPERFLVPGTRWLLRSHATTPEPIQLVRGRYLDGKGLYVVQFAGVIDRNQAEALRDGQLLVPEGDRPPLEDGEFHILDLIGLAVIDQATQTRIGTVISIIQAGNDLLEVQWDEGQRDEAVAHAPTVLIPFVEAIVPIVDLQQRRIEITPPPGLIV